MSNKKSYAVDTNVLLTDPRSIFSFEENDVIIPMAVLEELDRHKSRQDDVGRNARQVNRLLDEMRSDGNGLMNGVTLPSGGTLRIVSIDNLALKDMPVELQAPKVDNLIIAFMLKANAIAKAEKSEPPVLVSKDINVRIKCDSLGIKCEDYLKMRITDNAEKLYTGVAVVDVEESVVNDFFKQKGELELSQLGATDKTFCPNQIVVLKSSSGGQTSSAITKFVQPDEDNLSAKFVSLAKLDNVFGLKPRNKEQTFAIDLLFDPDIKLLTLTGNSGVGKTLITLAAALEQTVGLASSKEYQRYDKLIVTRPVQPVGKDIGFLPGTLEEKMEPWIAPIRDNLNFLMSGKRGNRRRGSVVDGSGKPSFDNGEYLSLAQKSGVIEIEAITYIRGRSIPNAFIIIDECQNLTPHELKTIVTRAGDGTKIVLLGDIEQIDNSHVDIFTNGLTHAIEKFKDSNIAGHVTLLKGERSKLATLASKIL